MVTPAETVTIELEARVREFERRIQGAERRFNRSMGNIERSGGQASRRVQGSFGGLGRAAGGFAIAAGVATAALGALAASRAYLQIVDGAKQIEAQLRLATRESGNFAQAQSDVRRIAQETRSELGATAQLYSVFQRNAVDLGISQEQSARATETVTKTFRISGATAAEAAGGLRQFLQGVQSGTLRGEELNSVLENAPRLARLLADSLDLPIGSLRELGQEGKLTADLLIDALTDQEFTAGLDAEFRELPVTFGEALQQIENAATIVFSAFDEGGDFSRSIVNFIQGGTGGFEDLEEAAREFGITVRSEIDGIIAFFEPLVDAFQDFSDLLEDLGIDNLLSDVQELTGLIPGGGLLTLIRGSERATQAREASRLQQEDRIRNREFNSIVNIDTIFDPVRTRRPTRTRSNSNSAAAAARRAAQAAARAERERIAEIRRSAQLTGQVADLEQSVADARAALLTAANDIVRFEVARNENARESALRRIDTELEIGTLTQEQADIQRDLVDQAADLRRTAIRRAGQAREFASEERAAEENLNALLDRGAVEAEILDAERQVARTSRERAEIEQDLIDLSFEQERLQNDFIIAQAERLANQQELLGLEQEEIDRANAAAEVARARNASLEERRGLAEQSNADANASPLQSFLLDIPRTADELNEALESVAANGISSVVDGLTEAIVNFESLGDVGRSILQSLTAQLVRLALQQLVLKTIGATAGNAATAATAAQASTTAAAWAPAASLAALATLGANAGPAAIALSTTTALSKALAATGGLRDGGEVIGPGGPRDDRVLKRLSNGEFVINASASRQIGRQALNFINSTGTLPTGLQDGGPAAPFSIGNGSATPGGMMGMAGIDQASLARLSQIVDAAARSMPPVNVFPTLDPASVLEAGVSTPRGQRVFFDFVSNNRGQFGEAVG